MPAGENATNGPERTENPLRTTRCGGTQTASPIFHRRLSLWKGIPEHAPKILQVVPLFSFSSLLLPVSVHPDGD
jgi:hypothetical protein